MNTSPAIPTRRPGDAANGSIVARLTRFVLVWTVASAILEDLDQLRRGRSVK